MTGTPDTKGKKGKKLDAQYLHPKNELKPKVGSGGLEESVIQSAQKTIDDNPTDFKPYAIEHLLKIKGVLCALDADNLDEQAVAELTQRIVEPVMQIKAHSGMFKFSLLGQVADICLFFIEHVEKLDHKGLNILHVFFDSMNLIIQRDMRGDGGIEGETLYIELSDVSQTYLKQQSF